MTSFSPSPTVHVLLLRLFLEAAAVSKLKFFVHVKGQRKIWHAPSCEETSCVLLNCFSLKKEDDILVTTVNN